MSALFGRVQFDRTSGPPDLLDRMRKLLAPFDPAEERRYAADGIDLLWQPLHATRDSLDDLQPHISSSGVTVVFDGRLDNQIELQHDLHLGSDATPVSIVAAAYKQSGPDCFRDLLGDWALSVWDPRKSLVILAKDFLGSRPLYYLLDDDRVIWSTALDTLVLYEDRSFSIDEEYLAGWLSSFPAPHRTPFREILAVPPASFVLIERARARACEYWSFDPRKRITYRTDREYEEHFRSVFAQAVRRRARSSSPILAELSGGMDSSSIVSMCDFVSEARSDPKVDTVSFFSNLEPHWNEEPYFRAVEEQRGRVGHHICVDHQVPRASWMDDCARVAPGAGRSRNDELAQLIRTHGYRIILSGIGGDEFTGGIPTPIPELQDLLATFQFRRFLHQLGSWAITLRRPWHRLVAESARAFRKQEIETLPVYRRPGWWLRPDFIERNKTAFLNYERRRSLLGPLPSFQENMCALGAIRRQLASSSATTGMPVEKRYPFLDRDFLEFIFAIPREQMVRPGERRSLMRRALKGIVPDAILGRKQKAYVSRAMQTAISAHYPELIAMCSEAVTAKLGIVDPAALQSAIKRVHTGEEFPGVSLMRSLGIESWMRTLDKHDVLKGRLLNFSSLSKLNPQAL